MPLTVIAKNQTLSDIDLDRLGVRVPASGQVDLTEFASYIECTEDSSLETAVSAGDIVINDGFQDLSTGEGVAYLDSSGNLNGPTSGGAADTVLVLKDSDARYTKATGVTIDGSDNLTTTGTVDAGAVHVGGSALAIDNLADVDTTTTPPSNGDNLEWDGSNWIPAAGGGGAGLAQDVQQAVGVSSNPTTTSNTPALMPDMQVTLNVTDANNWVLIQFVACVSQSKQKKGVNVRIFIDGVEEDGTSMTVEAARNGQEMFIGDTKWVQLSAASHTIEIRWSRTGNQGTVTAVGDNRIISAAEFTV